MFLSNNKRQKGTEGETSAALYLEKNGYRIIERNLRIGRWGEIDLIAENNGYLVFIEIKYRSSFLFGMPQEAVDIRKQKKLLKLALMYLKSKKINKKKIRFDVVAVTPEGCKIYKNAFEFSNIYY